MDCTLKKILRNEHEAIKNPALGEMMWTCPLMDRQICYWCCLHVYNCGQPSTRVMTSDKNPGYADSIAKIADRQDLDDVWETCSQCGRGGGQ